MADVRDEHGNPVQLTDELGNPVQLTDEYGNPMHLKGVATTSTTDTAGFAAHDPGVNTSTGTGATHGSVPATGATNGGVPTTGATHGGVPTTGATHGGVPTTGATHGGVPTTGATHGGVTMAEVMGIREHDQDKKKNEGEKGHELGRSSSSSSSSSEDDGQGGRRKKSLKQKIKEKLTGGKHKEDHPQAAQAAGHGVTYTASTATTITTTTAWGEHLEKKSMMEKIKEKLPGHHNHNH